MRAKKIDKFFLITVFSLIIIGAAFFVSASLGVLAKNKDLFYSVLRSQLILGLGIGFVGMYACLKIDYKFWRKHSLLIFLCSIFLTLAVFVPSLSLRHGGAERWVQFAGFSFQPVEFLKFGFIIYFAAWLSWVKTKVHDFKFGILPLLVLLSIIAGILLHQPDTKSFILITITGIIMLFVSGVPMKYILGFSLCVMVVLSVLVAFKPYLQDRVKTFINPASDPAGSSYQIQQSLIALGGGGIYGRGFGQSIQKFGYLPEAQGDSIFAVIGEEIGFVGSVVTIILYVLFTLRGFRIANHSPDLFSRLLVSGIVIMITAQSFMHIASVTGVFPLTGVPLVFMSHGGTALMVYMMAMGVVFQISQYQQKI
jgi:cell division protein FtsW